MNYINFMINKKEEIIIKTLVAKQHKNTPFNYWKYKNALSIDKVEHENGWIDYYVTQKRVGTISNRRKGIALVHSGNMFYLIDRDNNEVLSTNNTLIRIFGGYYISLGEHRFNYTTFPGQDRDTEYETMTVIHEIYDENGIRLNSEERKDLIVSMDILKVMTAVEIGEDRVFFNNALYYLEDYSLIAKFSKNIRLDGFFNNGCCKVRIPEDDRDIIVAVYEHKICHAFTQCDFERLAKVLNLDVEEEKSIYSVSQIVKKEEIEDMDSVFEYYPKGEISIERYHATAPTTVNYHSFSFQLIPMFTDEDFDTWKVPGMLDYFISCMACKYYKNNWNNCYLHIPYEGYKQLCESLMEVNKDRPNFIKKITKLGKCSILEKKYDIYRFECRPYGYITTSGELKYDFDVNNIKW